ncbi:hypothetical protein [Frigoribacterium sp. R86507]|uniref:hypothetical protein n=1 Tax=Frigoribacterium sp. R86507 TaxID=3093850 RepID=UPI0037C75B15
MNVLDQAALVKAKPEAGASATVRDDMRSSEALVRSMRERLSREIKRRLSVATHAEQELRLWEAVSCEVESLWSHPRREAVGVDTDFAQLSQDDQVAVALAFDLQLAGVSIHERLIRSSIGGDARYTDTESAREGTQAGFSDLRGRAFAVLAGDIAVHAARVLVRSVQSSGHADQLGIDLDTAAARLLGAITGSGQRP